MRGDTLNSLTVLNKHFGELNSRMQVFRDDIFNTQPRIYAQRAQIVTAAYRNNMDRPLVIRRALMLREILKQMEIFIEKDTLLAGNHAPQNRSASVFPEYNMDWIIAELEDFDRRPWDRFYITNDTKEELRSIAPFWERHAIKNSSLQAVPPGAILFSTADSYRNWANMGNNVVVTDYNRILKRGLKSYREDAWNMLENPDKDNRQNCDQFHFQQAGIIIVEALRDFANRYAGLADRMAFSEKCGRRKEELLEMSLNLRKVPWEPASGFYEAVQSLWLVHLCLQIESRDHSFFPSRIDQYLAPFFEKDINEGRITDDEACGLLTNLWLKTYAVNNLYSRQYACLSRDSFCQNFTMGGKPAKSGDMVCLLRFLILKSLAQARLPQLEMAEDVHNKQWEYRGKFPNFDIQQFRYDIKDSLKPAGGLNYTL
jgi:formate C-acetyltransferase